MISVWRQISYPYSALASYPGSLPTFQHGEEPGYEVNSALQTWQSTTHCSNIICGEYIHGSNCPQIKMLFLNCGFLQHDSAFFHLPCYTVCLFLQNIHLVAKWLSKLEKTLEQYSEGSHNSYRVYMSAEPAPIPESHIIPQGILESSIKITNEPPTGMLANLHKALDNFNQVRTLLELYLTLHKIWSTKYTSWHVRLK